MVFYKTLGLLCKLLQLYKSLFSIETTLSQDAIIAVASSLITIVSTICSIVFFTLGYYCGHHRKLQEQSENDSSRSPVTRAPVYEDVQPQQRTEELELKSNVAYVQSRIKLK